MSRAVRSHLTVALALCASAATASVAGCKGAQPEAPKIAANDEAGTPMLITAATDGGTMADAGGGNLRVAALMSPAPVFSATEFPPKDPTRAADERVGVIRLGYLRKGQTVAVKPQMIKKSNCGEGWFELVDGGFICGKFATLDMSNKELKNAPHAPLTDSPLPYAYGLNLTNGTPLYRRMPLLKERAEHEKALQVGKGERPAAVADENGEIPWYMKDHKGQRPQISFDELKGEGLVVMRMVRGFYLALDTEVSGTKAKFWRTTNGLLTPADHILVHKTKTEFEGVRIGSEGEKRTLPLAFVLGTHAFKFTLNEDPNAEKKFKRGADKSERFTVVELTGKKVAWEDKPYYETKEGWYMRGLDGTRTNPGPPPADLLPGEKWIDVNVSTQTLVAFEGDKPVYATLISSGRHNDEDKSKDHRTKQGSFRIREKHIAATMDDDGAADGTYLIQDVPWIMYFEGSFALHGAFWHASFGHERSHGCVNLQPFDAKNIFAWAGPHLPEGWHGVRATEKNPGTRVIVHE